MSASIQYSTGLPADQDTNDSQRTKFFVANMKYEFTEEDVKEWFSQFGVVESVRIVSGKDGKSRGFGFVEMESPEGTEAVKTFATAMNHNVTMMGWKNVNLKIHDEKRTKQYKNNNQSGNVNINGNGSKSNYNANYYGNASTNSATTTSISMPQYQTQFDSNLNAASNSSQPNWQQQQQQVPSYYSNSNANAGDQPPPYEASSSSNVSASVSQPPPYTESSSSSNYYSENKNTMGLPPMYSDSMPSNQHQQTSVNNSNNHQLTSNLMMAAAPNNSSNQSAPPSMAQGMGSNLNDPNMYNPLSPPPQQPHQPPILNMYGGQVQSQPQPQQPQVAMYGSAQTPQYYMPQQQQPQQPQQPMNYNFSGMTNNVNTGNSNPLATYQPQQQPPIQSQPPIPPPPPPSLYNQPINHNSMPVNVNSDVPDDIANKIFFKNLPLGTSVGELVEFVESHLPGNGVGRVRKANIQSDKNPRVHWCFAHVEFDAPSDAMYILSLPNLELKGRPVQCVLYRPKNNTSNSNSRYGPRSGGGRGRFNQHQNTRDNRRDRPY